MQIFSIRKHLELPIVSQILLLASIAPPTLSQDSGSAMTLTLRGEEIKRSILNFYPERVYVVLQRMRDAGTGIEGNAIASEFGTFTLGSILLLDLACIMESDDRLSAIDRLSLAKIFSATELGRKSREGMYVIFRSHEKWVLTGILKLLLDARQVPSNTLSYDWDTLPPLHPDIVPELALLAARRFPELRELAKNVLVRYAIQSKISLGEVLRLMCEADSQDFALLRDAISTSYPNAVFGGLQLSSKEMLTADDKLIISGMQMSNPVWRNRYLELQANRDVKELILSLSVSRDIQQLQERMRPIFDSDQADKLWRGICVSLETGTSDMREETHSIAALLFHQMPARKVLENWIVSSDHLKVSRALNILATISRPAVVPKYNPPSMPRSVRDDWTKILVSVLAQHPLLLRSISSTARCLGGVCCDIDSCARILRLCLSESGFESMYARCLLSSICERTATSVGVFVSYEEALFSCYYPNVPQPLNQQQQAAIGKWLKENGY